MLAKISKRFAILLILVLAAGLLGGGLPPRAAQARQLPPPPAGRPPYEGLPDTPRLPAAGAPARRRRFTSVPGGGAGQVALSAPEYRGLEPAGLPIVPQRPRLGDLRRAAETARSRPTFPTTAAWTSSRG